MTEVWKASVEDVMQHGVLSCQAEATARTVARMMAEHRIHSVVVTDLDGVSERAWGIVTDVDVLRAVEDDPDQVTAGSIAGTELVTISPGDSLEAAAKLMVEHDVTHVLVESESKPIGVVSTLDLAALIADRY
jgi:CBS domain-containing protein